MKRMLGVLILVLISITACGKQAPLVSNDYVWTQRSDGLMMKAPIDFRIRYEWKKDTLVWLENVTDAKGFQDLRSNSFFSTELLTMRIVCNNWDDANWSCVTSDLTDGKTILSQVMKDGDLTWIYWGEERRMKKRWLIWGHPIG